jgi:sugar phosphate isomerase/epimerase
MAKPQPFQQKNETIKARFLELKRAQPERFKRKLNLSWSNWGFGIEPLATTAKRLQASGITWIELHGNHYGADLGYRPEETKRILADHGIRCAGVCGMFSADNDLSSNRGIQRQAAVDYLKRTIPFTAAMGGSYLLTVPGAVGRPGKYDASEFERSVETLRLVADLFVQHRVRCAVEPIRAAEVSFIHTIADATGYIAAVGHPGVQHINGDCYHMLVGESHIGEALVAAGDRLTNLNIADTNRCALGDGSLDLDTIIMALYSIGYNADGRYVTPEPLGPGGDPYPAMFGKTDPKLLDELVGKTARFFREREEAVLAM